MHNGYLFSSEPALQTAKIQSVCFATPPVVTANIADAMYKDGLVLSVIKHDDAVPRFSRVNVRTLANEITEFSKLAQQWRQEDLEAVKTYAKTYGKAADMATNPVENSMENEEATDTLGENDKVKCDVSNDETSKRNDSVVLIGSKLTESSVPVTSTLTVPAVTSSVKVPAVSSTLTVPAITSAATVKAVDATKSSAATTATTSSSNSTVFGWLNNPTSRTLAFSAISSIATSASVKLKDVASSNTSSSSERVISGTAIADAAFSSFLNASADILASAPAVVTSLNNDEVSVDFPDGSSSKSNIEPIPIAVAVSSSATATVPLLDAFDSTEALKASSKSNSEIDLNTASLKDEPKLVIPGLIIQLYKNSFGQDSCALIDYNHASLNEFRVLIDRFVDEHSLLTHWDAMRSIHSCILSRLSNIRHYQCMKKLLPMRNQALSLTLADADNITDISISEKKQTSIKARDGSSEKVLEVYRKCGVCGFDTNWPYILKSDANRGLVSHNCSICGLLVCAVCGPAGDSIPGDGFNTTVTLPNWSLAAPLSIGGVVAKRVCAMCFLDSYNII